MKTKVKSKKPKKKELKTANEVLLVIREFMSRDGGSYDEQDKLWCVLAAMRGPDSQEHQPKDASTAVIRWAVLQKTGNSFIANPDSQKRAEYRREGKVRFGSSAHFSSHARMAFKALGLKWDEVNPDIRDYLK
jgi:hypothetical protein